MTRNAHWDTAMLFAQSSKEQSALPVTKDQICFIRFISPKMLALQSTAHTDHFPVLVPLLAFTKEWLHLVLGLSLNHTSGAAMRQLGIHVSGPENRKYWANPHVETMTSTER